MMSKKVGNVIRGIIRLTAIRLINWGVFAYETIHINGSALITGDNKSGKSTVVDAINYGHYGSQKFNRTAKDKDRSVLKYVRGDRAANNESKRYLRQGEICGYIVFEWFNETLKKYIVTGVCMTSVNSTSCDSTWFYKDDCRLDDLVFGTKNGNAFTACPLTELLYKDGKRFDGYTEKNIKGCEQILYNLGLRCDLKMLRRREGQICAFDMDASGFSINNFIQDQILAPHNIQELDNILRLRDKCEEIDVELDGYQRQRDALGKVISAYEEYSMRDKTLRSNKLLQLYQVFKNREKAVADRIAEYNAAKVQLKSEQERISRLNDERLAAYNEYDQAKKNSGIDNIYKQIESYEARIADTEKKIQQAENEKKRLEHMVSLLTGEFEWLLDNMEDDSIADKIRLCLNGDGDDTTDITTRALMDIDSHRKSEIHSMQVLNAQRSAKRKELDHDIQDIGNKIDRLNKHGIFIPEHVMEVCILIKNKLAEKGIKAELKPFALYVSSITDESWRDALEAFIGHRRYSIIVEPKYAMDAMKVKTELDNSRNPALAAKARKTSLIITDRIPASHKTVVKGSAAELLEINNPTARLYANFILNNIHLCKDITELHNDYYMGGIMKDGHLALACVFSFISGYSNVEYSLGHDSMQKQLSRYNAEEKKLKEEWNNLILDISNTERDIDGLVNLCVDPEEYNLRVFRDHKELLVSHDRDTDALEKLRSRPDFLSSQDAVRAYKEAYEAADRAYVECSQKIGSTGEKINNLEDVIEESREEADNARSAFEARSREWADVAGGVEAGYNERVRKGLKSPVSDARIDQDAGLLEKARENLFTCQNDLAVTYPQYINFTGTNPANNQRFQNDYNMIVDTKLDESRAKLANYRQEMNSIFRNDFIKKLGEHMKEGERSIAELNRLLKTLPFCGDTYEFKMKRLDDRKPIFDEIARMRNPAYQMLAAVESEPNEELDEMINQMVTDILRDEECKDDYADYRKYFSYDMVIHRIEGSDTVEYNFEEKMGSASTSEKETPGFILLVASLANCFPANTTCARLVVIDEAFCHMSPPRIAQMVNYLNTNGIQALYFAPAQTLNTIGMHTDSCAAIVRPETAEYAHVYDVTKEELVEWCKEFN